MRAIYCFYKVFRISTRSSSLSLASQIVVVDLMIFCQRVKYSFSIAVAHTKVAFLTFGLTHLKTILVNHFTEIVDLLGGVSEL